MSLGPREINGGRRLEGKGGDFDLWNTWWKGLGWDFARKEGLLSCLTYLAMEFPLEVECMGGLAGVT